MVMGHTETTVGDAARRSGLSPKAVRLYEARGILPPTARTEAGYRTYTEEDLAVLRFVRRAKALGLRLDEVKDILDLQRGGAQPCGRVIELLEARLGEIDATVADLVALRSTLAAALDSARSSSRRGEPGVVCRIIEPPAATPPT